MSNQPDNSRPEDPASGVPREFIDEMHEKTKHLTRARQQLDDALGSTDPDALEKRDHAVDEAAAAEKDIEKTDEKIKPALKKNE